jgi:hypothetical protein
VLPGQPEVSDGQTVRFGWEPRHELWFDAAGERIEL